MQNNSPWLEELDPNFSLPKLETDQNTDLCIIGGGFSGLTSAYFILKNTKHNLTLIESGQIGHGATGHNAGQLFAGFEIPYQSINRLYGPKISSYSQRIINNSWKLLRDLFGDTHLRLACLRFKDFDGFVDPKHVQMMLEESLLKNSHGLPFNPIYLSDSSYLSKSLEKKYQPYYKLVTQTFLNHKLKTKGFSFIAAQKSDFGILNSALFCQRLATYLLTTYPERLQIYEHTPAEKFSHKAKNVLIQTPSGKIKATNCLFCTNGYRLKPVNKLFTQNTAYMLGRLRPSSQLKPQARAYYLNHQDDYYVTRRPFLGKNLFTFGGPEIKSGDQITSSFIKDNQNFLKSYTNYSPLLYKKRPTYQWSGHMAYTAHGLRIAGQDKLRRHYWYNLGCNGIGLLPALATSHRLSLLLAGKKLPKSIFDPG